jgi:hypothetical protein
VVYVRRAAGPLLKARCHSLPLPLNVRPRGMLSSHHHDPHVTASDASQISPQLFRILNVGLFRQQYHLVHWKRRHLGDQGSPIFWTMLLSGDFARGSLERSRALRIFSGLSSEFIQRLMLRSSFIDYALKGLARDVPHCLL